LYTLDYSHETLAFKRNATNYLISDTSLSGRNGLPIPTMSHYRGTNNLVNVTANDVSAAVIPNQPTQTVTDERVGYVVGKWNKGNSETVNLTI